MKRALASALVVVCLVQVVLAVDGNKAMYVGGTRTDIKEAAEGRFDVSNETDVAFTPDKTKVRHTIAYSNISDLEYGQKAGRRVAVGLLISPIALFSKKRKHYLTINYTDAAGKEAAVVFKLGRTSSAPRWRSSKLVLASRSPTRTMKRESLARVTSPECLANFIRAAPGGYLQRLSRSSASRSLSALDAVRARVAQTSHARGPDRLVDRSQRSRSHKKGIRARSET